MIWRSRGEIIFRTRAARNQFMTEYDSFVVGRTRTLDRTAALDQEVDDDGTIYPLPPTVRFDVVFENQNNTSILFDTLRDRSLTNVTRVAISIHQCRIAGSPGPYRMRYFGWP